MKIVENSLYLILFILIITFLMLLISKFLNTKKLKKILNNQEETKTELELIEEKKDNFFYEDASMEEIKEHLSLLNTTKRNFFNSDSLTQEIEVDFVIASQVLKNWEHNSLVSEDNKVILKKVNSEKEILKENDKIINLNINQINSNSIDEIEESKIYNNYDEDEQLIKQKIEKQELKNKIIIDEKVKNKVVIKEEVIKEELEIEKNNEEEILIINEELFYNKYLNQDNIKLNDILLKTVIKMNEKEYSIILDDETNININLKEFLNILYTDIQIFLNLKIEFSFTYNDEIIINDLMINFFTRINEKLNEEFFKISELKNKKHIAKKYLFVFNENQENEVLIQDYYLCIQNNDKVNEIISEKKAPDKIIKTYHQIKLYLMNKNKIEEKPF